MLSPSAQVFQPGQPVQQQQRSPQLQHQASTQQQRSGRGETPFGGRMGPSNLLSPHVLQQIQSQIGNPTSPQPGSLSPGLMPPNAPGQRTPSPNVPLQGANLRPPTFVTGFNPNALPWTPGGGQANPIPSPGFRPSISPLITPGFLSQQQQQHQQQQQQTPHHLPLLSPGVGPMPSSPMSGAPPVSTLSTSPGFFGAYAGQSIGTSPSTPGLQGPPVAGNLHSTDMAPMPRRGRGDRSGPPQHTPLKTSRHNSTPSVSIMNPAAFAASLGKPRVAKKVTVTMPREVADEDDRKIVAEEGDRVDDEEEMSHDAGGEAEDTASDPPSPTRLAKKRLLMSARTRLRWVPRDPRPVKADYTIEAPTPDPEETVTSRAIFPEQRRYSAGLPNTMDIYLPGRMAWEEYEVLRREERRAAAEFAANAGRGFSETDDLAGSPPTVPGIPETDDGAWGLGTGGGDGAAFGLGDDKATDHVFTSGQLAYPHGRSVSISSPADPNMVSFKLQRYLQSTQPGVDASSDSESATSNSLARLSDLPSGLRPATSSSPRKLGNGRSKLSSAALHSHTMSLSMPSSGGAFGPAAFSALGLGDYDRRETGSDKGNDEPALGQRPNLERNFSTGNLDLGGSSAAMAIRPLAQSAAPAWKDLSAGFGYDIEEEEEPVSLPAHSRGDSRVQDDMRTNPSEDDGASNHGEDDVGHAVQSDSDYIDDDDLSDTSDSRTPSEGEYSNPSDEEAAAEERRHRRALRAEQRAAKRIAAQRAQERHERIGRDRSGTNGTNDTIPSSALGIGEGIGQGPWAADEAAGAQSLGIGVTTRRRSLLDIVSNPSDDEDDDADEQGTFGGSARGPLDDDQEHDISKTLVADQTHARGSDDNGKMSTDFAFPRPATSVREHSFLSGARVGGVRDSYSEAQQAPLQGSTMGRRAGRSPFAAAAAATEQAARDRKKHSLEQNDHFRLPSINRSSFGGSSSFGAITRNAPPVPSTGVRTTQLRAAAPSFTPGGAFTFTAPGGAPRLLKTAMKPPLPPDHAMSPDQVPLRDEGRSKRAKRQSWDEEHFVPSPAEPQPTDDADWEDYEGYASRSLASGLDVSGATDNPPRPRATTASIPGNLRAASNAPPFDVSGASRLDSVLLPPGQQYGNARDASQSDVKPPTGAFSFTQSDAPVLKPTAPVFVPTWSRTGDGGASRRLGLPDFSTVSAPTAHLTDVHESKAVPIRKPSQDTTLDEDHAAVRRPAQNQPTGHQPTAGHSLRNGGGAQDRPYKDGFEVSSTAAIPVAPRNQHASISRALGRSLHKYHRSDSDASHALVEGSELDDVDSEDDGEDIIEELAERMDKTLEGWAGKILDEVTIMGQVRPPAGLQPGGRIDPLDREALLSAFGRQLESVFEIYLGRFQQSITALIPSPTVNNVKALEATSAVQESAVPRALSGHPPLDSQGELDFDYVSEVLDAKIASLKRELMAAFDTALPRAMESAAIPQAPPAIALAPPPSTITNRSVPPELPEANLELLTEALIGQIKEMFAETDRTARQRLREDIAATLEPMLEDNQEQALVKAAADRQEVAHQMAESVTQRLTHWERVLSDFKGGMEDHMQVAIINGVVPHLETLRTEPTDPDVVAARVTEIILPMLEDRRERSLDRRDSEPRSASGAMQVQPEVYADATLEKLLPFISAIKSEPADTDALVQRVSEIVKKQSVDNLFDLEPVLALLEPLVAKQEEVRTIARQMMDRQRDVDSTLNILPTAINAKTEVFLSAAQQTQEKQDSILNHIAELRRVQDRSTDRIAELDEKRDELVQVLEVARKEAHERKVDADEARAELSASSGYNETLREELTRLESRLEQAERDSKEVTDALNDLRSREENAKERAHLAERRADELDAQVREIEAVNAGAFGQRDVLQGHVDDILAQLKALQVERDRDREAAAQATAQALARAERAEAAANEAQRRADERVDKAAAVERAAQSDMREMGERAARAEGELASLEKRVVDQDAKISTLQQVNATQKQKAAQSQQRLSEAEKKTKDYERTSEELAIARGRLEEMESRVADREALDERLRASQDCELKLRDELSTYHSRFLELEKDLITMKETLVGRDELEASQSELAASREEVARLRGQLTERERPNGVDPYRLAAPIMTKSRSNGTAAYSGEGVGHDEETWNGNIGVGMPHGVSGISDRSPSGGPYSSSYDATELEELEMYEHSVGSAHHSMGKPHFIATSAKPVEQSDDGWWS